MALGVFEDPELRSLHRCLREGYSTNWACRIAERAVPSLNDTATWPFERGATTLMSLRAPPPMVVILMSASTESEPLGKGVMNVCATVSFTLTEDI